MGALSSIEQIIAGVAGTRSNAALALATANREAPTFLRTGNPADAIGDPMPWDARSRDGYCSFGPFQENICGGAGQTYLDRGGSFTGLFDPAGATARFLDRVAGVRASGFVGTPGEIAAAAQRPADPGAYATAVDIMYPQKVALLGGGDPGAAACPSIDCAEILLIDAPGTGNTAAAVAARHGTTIECVRARAYSCAGNVRDTPLPFVGTGDGSGIGGAIAGAASGLAVNVLIVGAILGLGYLGIRKTL